MELIEKFFATLRQQKFVFFLPEGVWRAYRDGLLTQWRIPSGDSHLLHQVGIYREYHWRDDDWRTEAKDPLLTPTFVDGEEWKGILAHIEAKERGRRYMMVADGGWAFSVRFFLVNVLQGLSREPASETERDEMIADGIQRLRREYGLPVIHSWRGRGKMFEGHLIVVSAVYKPEQLRKARRRSEDILRKDDAMAARVARFLKLLK